jgi:hypothetical protein
VGIFPLRDGSGPSQHPDSFIIKASKTRDAVAINTPSLWAKFANPVAPGSENNENLKLVIKMFGVHAKGGTVVLRQVVNEDIESYIPGRHSLAAFPLGIDGRGVSIE